MATKGQPDWLKGRSKKGLKIKQLPLYVAPIVIVQLDALTDILGFASRSEMIRSVFSDFIEAHKPELRAYSRKQALKSDAS